MSDAVENNGGMTLVVDTEKVSEAGRYIYGLATVNRDDPDTGIAALQHRLNTINDDQVPYVPWGYIDAFITAYIQAYNDVLNKRGEIGQILITNVAATTEEQDIIIGKQFQAQP